MTPPVLAPLVLIGADVHADLLTHPDLHQRPQNLPQLLRTAERLLQQLRDSVDTFHSHRSSP